MIDEINSGRSDINPSIASSEPLLRDSLITDVVWQIRTGVNGGMLQPPHFGARSVRKSSNVIPGPAQPEPGIQETSV
jgi:hypothetical protein